VRLSGLRAHRPGECPRGSAGRRGDVRARLEHAGLEVADVFLILGLEGFEELAINHPDPAVRSEALAYFVATVAFARLLGAPGVSVLPGMEFDGVEPDAGLRLAADELQRRAELAGEAGLALSFEPHYQSIVERPEDVQRLLELAPDAALALDYSHFVFQGVAQADVDALIPHARHVHLRQAAPGAMQLPTHAGVIDFACLVEQLDAAGYDGYLTLEYQCEEWLDCNRVDCISETAALRDVLLA
jgi:sugar phosphate isomerase/epimerase